MGSLVDQINKELSNVKSKIEKQKAADEQTKLRKLQQEMEEERRKKEAEEAEIRRLEEERKQRAEMEQKRKQHLRACNKILTMQMQSWHSSMNKKEEIMKLHYGWQKKVEEGWMNSHQVSKEVA